MSLPSVLLVEDEPSIAENVVFALQQDQMQVQWAADGQSALDRLTQDPGISIVLLDVGLPDMSGFDVCRQIRLHSQIPIVFLTARDSEIDRVVGLELGADDYVAKPFSPRELGARVRAILRRTERSSTIAPLPSGPIIGAQTPARTEADVTPGSTFCHQPEQCRFSYRGQWLDLTRNEYRLLLAFTKHPRHVLSRDQLMELAWEDPASASDRTVDAHVKSLRAKIRALAPEIDPIETRRGLGYAWNE